MDITYLEQLEGIKSLLISITSITKENLRILVVVASHVDCQLVFDSFPLVMSPKHNNLQTASYHHVLPSFPNYSPSISNRSRTSYYLSSVRSGIPPLHRPGNKPINTSRRIYLNHPFIPFPTSSTQNRPKDRDTPLRTTNYKARPRQDPRVRY